MSYLAWALYLVVRCGMGGTLCFSNLENGTKRLYYTGEKEGGGGWSGEEAIRWNLTLS